MFKDPVLSPLLAKLFQHSSNEEYRPIDRQFAVFVQNLSRECSGERVEDDLLDKLGCLSAMLSHSVAKGHVCIELKEFADEYFKGQIENCIESLRQCKVVFQVPSNARPGRDLLNENPMVEGRTPIVLDGQYIYLHRYWQYEHQLSGEIHKRLKDQPWSIQLKSTTIKKLFSINHSKEVDWQAVAAVTSAQKQFSVITGGPGTGKTTTVVKLLFLLCELYQARYHRPPIMKLAAPTGKAAMRLSESIKSAKQNLDGTKEQLKYITEEASTLHRLLGQSKDGQFIHNYWNPLHVDVLIVDEASMIDLPLMAKLMSALPPKAQIIMLGDKDQLASVEAGSVLGDICADKAAGCFSKGWSETLQHTLSIPLKNMPIELPAIADHICQLKKSYRFDENSGIGHLARAANAGNFTAWQSVMNKGFLDINFLTPDLKNQHNFYREIVKGYTPYLNEVNLHNCYDDQRALYIHKLFSRFRVLVAIREGDYGVSGVNLACINAFAAHNLVHWSEDMNTTWVGKPLLIMENDYSLKLFNGDVGILLPVLVDEDVVLKASFVTADGEVRWVKPSRLPKHETAFAMTVHKSQGSEFDHCALLLPEIPVPVLNRELIYTGITRAKAHLTLSASEKIVKFALGKTVSRSSGLRERLWLQSSELVEKQLSASDILNDGQEQNEDGQYSLF